MLAKPVNPKIVWPARVWICDRNGKWYSRPATLHDWKRRGRVERSLLSGAPPGKETHGGDFPC
jgi:hypothetical protein